MSSGKGWGLKGRALLIVGIMLISALSFGGGFKWAEALTANGSWSGDWITEVWGNFTSGLYVEDLTAGRPVISVAGGRLSTDADMNFVTDTLTVTKLGATTLAGDISASNNDVSGLGWANGTSLAFSNAYVTTYYLGATNINARLGGNFGALDLTTTGDVSATWGNFTNAKFTNDFYYGASNVTDLIAYPESEADYIVWVEGATYYAKNGHSRQVTSNVDAATLINTVFNLLTAGRTWKEKVTLKGTFTLTDGIGLPSYIIFDFSQANLIVACNPAAPHGVVYNINHATTDSYIEIIGGLLNNNNYANTELINLTNVTHLKIYNLHAYQPLVQAKGVVDIRSSDVEIFDSVFENIYIVNILDPSDTVNFHDNYIINTYDSGVSVGSATTSVPTNIKIHHNTMILTSQVVGNGVDIFGNVDGIEVFSNDIYNSYGENILVQQDGGALYSPRNVKLGFNDLNTTRTIGKVNIKVDPLSSNIDILYNKIYNPASLACIRINYSSNVRVIGNDINGNNVANVIAIDTMADSTAIPQTVTDLIISQNDVVNCTYGVALENVAGGTTDDVDVYQNDLSGATNPIYTSGTITNLRIHNNDGYVTESSGTATLTAGNLYANVTHGLSYTPAAGDISITLGVGGSYNCTSVGVSYYGATYFTVRAYDNTGANKKASGNITVNWKGNKP